MPAYANMSLMRLVFHPSDVAFAIGWSNSAAGFGTWRVVLDQPTKTALVSVIPPGSDTPVFFLARHGGEVVLRRQLAGHDRTETGRFKGLREALMVLCPLDDEALEEIHVGLERDFPRPKGR